MSAWKPGDVALATYAGVPNVRVSRYDDIASGWARLTDPDDFINDNEAEGTYRVTDIRPLAVIDPEGISPRLDAGWLREAASDLKRIDGYGSSRVLHLVYLADQIEAQTRPPKPPEPTDFAAIAVERDGTVWHRVRDGEGDGRPWATRDSCAVYANLDIVKTYPPFTPSGEGVTP